eukprot:1235826-Pleurochrysis_carterae.AAC.2
MLGVSTRVSCRCTNRFKFGLHRWLYANALLPAVQFSIPPWSYGDETNKICKKAIDLREQRLPQLQVVQATDQDER